jgi:diphosphomevalonate decarboxylase
MGKVDATKNLPANPSISLTLDSLCTLTEVELVSERSEPFDLEWQGVTEIEGRALRPLDLREKDRPKMLAHFRRIFEHFQQPLVGRWKVRTGNAFPAGAGIASSASGFAALTLAIASVLKKGRDAPSASTCQDSWAALSRQGSGSSCRSFGGPWVLWEGERTSVLESNFEPLSDLVILIEEKEKAVSSTDAHRRVLSSPLWEGRVARVHARLQRLRSVLISGNWQQFSTLAWEEAMDMHELFHTAEPSFSFWQPQTREVLAWLESLGVRTGQDGANAVKAAVTLDAGPNIHLLIPQCDEARWLERLQKRFPEFTILVDRQGMGARCLALGEEIS